MMGREVISISDSGVVNVPRGEIMMSEFEIAELLGVMVPTVRGKIQTLLKSRMCVESCGGVVRGNRIVPEYFGLEVVIAVAMQVDSYEADLFRKWVIRGITNCDTPMRQRTFITLHSSQICN